MRSQALNQLLHGTPDLREEIETTTQSNSFTGKLPPYFVNAIIDEVTGEVNIPAIVDCDTGMINAVIDPLTGEQIYFRHLISDEATQETWDTAMCSEVK